ncbi:hypothetical protein DRE_01780 [Drechslerella stenobrocha 248]|uniref:Uncharacterized protein n=1 Tax=Drechslerella stenobrocha 248 TaxID=1043628 RepID=W7I8D5_9PEZI|nr:hypothetical protein DRE_01780 [Drechslerella stenobrocha 248]
MAMLHDVEALPSTAALLDNLQDDPKGLDIFAYLLELQASSKSDGAPNPLISKLADQLYSFVLYPKNRAQDIRQRLSEATELLRRHEKLHLRSRVLSSLVAETLLLIRLCLLDCRDDYGLDLPKIYNSVPQNANDSASSAVGNQTSISGFDVEAETKNVELQASKQLLPLLGSKSSILQATKDRLLFLEDLLSERAEQLHYLVLDYPAFTTLLVRMCMSATYSTEQGVVLSSVRLLRLVYHLHGYFLRTSLLNGQPTLDLMIFGHIESLLQLKHKMQINAGYHVWIGLLDDRNDSSDLDPIIRTEVYWQYILSGLDAESGEVKKICLHVLWSTIQRLMRDLDLRTGKTHPAGCSPSDPERVDPSSALTRVTELQC